MEQNKKEKEQAWLEINEDTINHFGREIAIIETWVLALKEIEFWYDKDIKKYQTTAYFWSLTYKSYWRNLILDLAKIIDKDRRQRSMSMRHLLVKFFSNDDEGKVLLNLFTENKNELTIYNKIMTLRDQIVAHSEGEVFTKTDEAILEYIKQHRCDFKEISIFVDYLKRTYTLLSTKLKSPISLGTVRTTIRKEIIEIFEKIQK